MILAPCMVQSMFNDLLIFHYPTFFAFLQSLDNISTTKNSSSSFPYKNKFKFISIENYDYPCTLSVTSQISDSLKSFENLLLSLSTEIDLCVRFGII